MVMSNTRGLPTVRFQSLANFLLTTFRKTGIKKEAVNGPILENLLVGKWKLGFFLKHSYPNRFYCAHQCSWTPIHPKRAYRSQPCSLTTATGSEQALGKFYTLKNKFHKLLWGLIYLKWPFSRSGSIYEN